MPIRSGQRLVGSRIARPEDIAGCSGEEILDLQQSLGPLTGQLQDRARRDRAPGRPAGRTTGNSGFMPISSRRCGGLRANRSVTMARPDDDFVPEDAVLSLVARYGEHPWFIRGGEEGDSPVWSCNTDTGRVALIGLSVWDWVRGDSFATPRRLSRRGLPEQNARRANGPTPAPKRGFRAWTF